MSIIGIDAGISAIKIVNMDENEQILNKKAYDQATIIQALDKFVNEENIDLNNVSMFIITGVGKDEIKENIYNIKTLKVDEFKATGRGGLYLSNLEKAVIVSIGTGTSLIFANKDDIKHIGGTGVGGGTLFNMLKLLCNVKSFEEIEELIKNGNLNNVDLKIKDITTEKIDGLEMDTTAVNFGKLGNNIKREDITLGIVNMVFETIGMMAVFATKNIDCKDIVLLGGSTANPYLSTVLKNIEKIHNVRFIVPNNAQFGTVIGALKSIKR